MQQENHREKQAALLAWWWRWHIAEVCAWAVKLSGFSATNRTWTEPIAGDKLRPWLSLHTVTQIIGWQRWCRWQRSCGWAVTLGLYHQQQHLKKITAGYVFKTRAHSVHRHSDNRAAKMVQVAEILCLSSDSLGTYHHQQTMKKHCWICF